MNRRQKKKSSKKVLPIFADEFNLLTMTPEELKEAFADCEHYRQRYGFRKKYSNLKHHFLRYFYPCGETFKKECSALNSLFRAHGEPVIVTQSLPGVKPSNTAIIVWQKPINLMTLYQNSPIIE